MTLDCEITYVSLSIAGTVCVRANSKGIMKSMKTPVKRGKSSSTIYCNNEDYPLVVNYQ